MNYRELFIKLYDDKCFRNFCSMIDELRNREYKIEIPLETITLLIASNVDYVKGEDNIEVIHNHVKYFLNPNGMPISKTTSFYDYFVITNIMRIADEKVEKIEENKWRQLPLDLTEYANSICKFDTCTCGHKPNIVFSCFWNSLTGKVICEKCGLSVNMLFTHEADIFHGDSGTVYINLEDGIKKLSDLWNKEVAKNESILHRTMRELLSYGSNENIKKGKSTPTIPITLILKNIPSGQKADFHRIKNIINSAIEYGKELCNIEARYRENEIIGEQMYKEKMAVEQKAIEEYSKIVITQNDVITLIRKVYDIRDRYDTNGKLVKKNGMDKRDKALLESKMGSRMLQWIYGSHENTFLSAIQSSVGKISTVKEITDNMEVPLNKEIFVLYGKSYVINVA